MRHLKIVFYTTHIIKTISTEIIKREDGLYFMRERTPRGTKQSWTYLPKGINTFKGDIREMIEKELFNNPDTSNIRCPQKSLSDLTTNNEYILTQKEKDRSEKLGKWLEKDMEEYRTKTGRYAENNTN